MPKELANLKRGDIDLERGIIRVQGLRGQNSRIFKLSDTAISMLRVYLQKNKDEHPFPSSEWICKCYMELRNRLAEKLKDLTIKSIRLYDWRHYYATMLYYKTKDILLVKQLMKKRAWKRRLLKQSYGA